MAVSVARHDYPVPSDQDARLEYLTESTMKAVAGLERGTRDFDSAFQTALIEAEARCLTDPTASERGTWSAFVVATQVGSALFASAEADGDSVRERIGDSTRVIPDSDALLFADASTWTTAFWLAVIGRDKELITRLCNFPVSSLRAEAAEMDEFNYAWVDTLKTYWLSGPDLGDKLVSAVEGCNPETVGVTNPDAALMLFYPPMLLFQRFILDDHVKFNEALADALEWHKEYWSEDEDRSGNVDGLLPLEVLGVACLAFDAGFPIDVDSDYLPEHLLKRRWLDDSPA